MPSFASVLFKDHVLQKKCANIIYHPLQGPNTPLCRIYLVSMERGLQVFYYTLFYSNSVIKILKGRAFSCQPRCNLETSYQTNRPNRLS